jgi:hypothetical protein
MKPFAGTDFWLADLGMEFLHWPSSALLRKEMRRGRSCKVLESTNPQLGKGAYGRVRSWIDSESAQLIRAEAYDSENRLLKEFSPGQCEEGKRPLGIKRHGDSQRADRFSHSLGV